MEISNEIKAKVFAQYLDQPIRMILNSGEFRVGICTLNTITLLNKEDQLILKPLSAISDEDAVEVAKMFHPGNDMCQVLRRNKKGDILIIDVDSSHSTEYSLQIELDFSGKSDIHGSDYKSFIKESHVWEVRQFLQSRGYDLPNYLLGGKTLHESGLAIYE